MQHRQDRVKVDRPILLKLSNGWVVKARICNLSPGGLALLYPAPAELGATLGLRFQLPDKQNDPVDIICHGIVRNCHIYQTQFVTGLEFKNIGEYEKDILFQFINQKRSRQNTVIIAA